MQFLRAIRLDPSDQEIFPSAAQPGEWAVPGSFALWDVDPDQVRGKQRQAFRHGFVGTESFGWTTLVVTAEISAPELDAVTERLTAHLLQHYGAPDRAAARETAEEEVRFTLDLCQYPPGTCIAVEREHGPEQIEESFRKVALPDASNHDTVRLWGVDS
jgi:hypothetical protein